MKTIALSAVLGLGLLGTACGGTDKDSGTPGGGGASAGTGGIPTAGSSSGAAQGGTGSGMGGSKNMAGNGGTGGGKSGPPVPRVENSDGPSVLDMPQTQGFGGKGKCEGTAVFCGACLGTENQAMGSCTALKLGLGQAASLALTEDALYYTAANREILKLELASGKHSSLVRGLSFVDALTVEGQTLYFATEAPDTLFDYEARRVDIGGGDVTVISPPGEDIGAIIPLPDKLLLGIGSFEYDFFTVPKEGGPATAFGNIRGATSPLLGGTTLYYRTDRGLSSTDIAAPMPNHTLNNEFGNTRLMLQGDYLYYAISGSYSRTPIAGGPVEEIQKLKGGVWGRTPTHVVIETVDETDKTLSHISVMPIEGGTPVEVTTLEQGELRAVAGNATDLYLGVGSLHVGGLLKVALPK